MKAMTFDPADVGQVQDLVLAERQMSLSDREWRHRLRGYGYGLRESGRKLVVTALLGNADLIEIDKDALNA